MVPKTNFVAEHSIDIKLISLRYPESTLTLGMPLNTRQRRFTKRRNTNDAQDESSVFALLTLAYSLTERKAQYTIIRNGGLRRLRHAVPDGDCVVVASRRQIRPPLHLRPPSRRLKTSRRSWGISTKQIADVIS